ncbi:glycosyltransferase family 2 protein [Furfurilactobacillus sp. WILCCON 0119]
MMTTKLTIIIPVYNEAAVLTASVQRLLAIEDGIAANNLLNQRADLLIVDDCSTDKTWSSITKMHEQNARVRGLRFSRNFGHQQALMAGLAEAVKTADLMVTIDADLQDDPDKIPEMVEQAMDGMDIVDGVRNNRETDGWFKRTSAQSYYKVLRALGVELVPNHADFRLMSRRAVETLLAYPERNLFIRGLIPRLGYPTGAVYYKRTPRLAGESKYPLKKMLALAWDGITSLTVAPIRLLLIAGAFACLLAVVMGLAGLVHHGWSPLMTSLWLLGGGQMIGIGIVGEYIGKIMIEVKGRPRYTIQTVLE